MAGHGEYAFADVPTHDDGLDAPPSVGANRREETANAFAVGASLAAAKLADARAKHAVSFHSANQNAADAAVQRARDFVFDADDAPNSLAQLRSSAMDVARAKAKVFEAGALTLTCVYPLHLMPAAKDTLLPRCDGYKNQKQKTSPKET